MSSTLISFDGKYYEYHGEKKEEQGLAIGGYELDFLSNLVASYLFLRKPMIFSNQKNYHGIYQDYGLVVFRVKKSVKEIKYWLEEFQQTVNRSVGNQQLQFNADICTTDANTPSLQERTIFKS